MITPYNILRHEFIGLGIQVLGSPSKDDLKISGVVIDETKETFKVKIQSNKIKAIQKKDRKFEVKLGSETVVKLDGCLINQRPEERIKKKTRIKFA
ncbi:ribonuclease P protein component 1 [Candidatus Altiarchaeota archaeon]